MKHAAVKKHLPSHHTSNDNDLEAMERYRQVAQEAHRMCKSADLDEFEEKYGLSTFA